MSKREYIITWIIVFLSISVVGFVLYLITHPKVLQDMFEFIKYP